MMDPASLLTQPAPEAARALALRALARLAAVRAQLRTDTAHADAVHDARVAITRLRATLRAYHEVLGRGIGRRGRRDLTRLNRTLGQVRDLDVQRRWLTAHLETMPERAREGAQEMLNDLAHRRERRAQRIDPMFTRHFDAAVASWQHRLTHYRERRVVGEPLRNVPLAAMLVQRMHDALHRVEQAVAQAGEAPDSEQLHTIRVLIKRVRALLVPWIDEIPASRPLYELLSAAQDVIGQSRDIHLLATRARRYTQPGMVTEASRSALADFSDDERERSCSMLSGAWLADVHATAVRLVPDTAHALAAIARADQEIERKFLLSVAPPHAVNTPGVRIAQGWLPGERLRERLRRSVHADGRVEWTRTIKFGTGIARTEVEEATEPLLFESLWPLTASARVEKVRHTVTDGAFSWEVDVFLDRDLVLAEVELPSEHTLVSLPAWLAPYVVREVTGEAAYVNANLAQDRRISSASA